jgi:hypothetical protein
VIRGSECVILTVDDARKILDAVRTDWSRARIERLQQLGLFEAVDRFQDLVRACERKDEE